MRTLKLTHSEIEIIITALEINRDQLLNLSFSAKTLQQTEISENLMMKANAITEQINAILDGEKDV